MTSEPIKKTRRGFWIAVLTIAVLGCLILLASVGFLGLYFFSSSAERAAPFRLLARILPFPAAQVDGEYIRYSEWSETSRAFTALAEEGKVTIPGAVSRHDIAKNVMDRLIRNRVLEKVAKERGIQVSAKEIDDEYDKVVADSKDRKTLEEMLRALGWRESDVKEKIVRPYLLGRRLGERVGSVAEAEKIISEAIKNANTKIFVRF